MQNRSSKFIAIFAIAVLVEALLPRFIGTARAASAPQFSSVVVRLDKITPSTYTGGTVCIATPVSTGSIPGFGTETHVDVGFPDQSGVVTPATDDYQVNTTLTPTNPWITSTTPPASPGTGSQYWPNINISGTPVAPAAWPSIGSNAIGATNTSYSLGNPQTLKVVRFTTGFMVANKTYCFDFKSGSNAPAAETGSTFALKTPTTGTNGYQEDVPGFVATYVCSSGCTTPGAGTVVEQSFWGTQITGIGGFDNTIVVSAVVPPIFEMDFASNVDSFPVNLDPNTVKTTTGNTVEVKTNAKGGWMVWTKSKNQALTSAASGGSIPSVGWNTNAVTALVAGTPGYNMNVAVTANVETDPTLCTAQAETEYFGSLASFEGGMLTADWEMAADCSTATPPGTDGGTNITFQENAAIAFSTPASADYTDTIFVTGAGQF
jgi:hypothetical protein